MDDVWSQKKKGKLAPAKSFSSKLDYGCKVGV